MKHSLILLMVVCLHTAGYAQIVNYLYDNSGNRTSRTLTLSKSLLNGRDTTMINEDKITEQLGEKSIVVYPNPASEEVNVEITGYDENLDGSISLIDQGGRLLINQQHLSVRNTFNLTQYSQGVYFMIIRIGTNQSKYTIIKN